VGGDEFVLLLSPLEDTDAWQPIVQRVLDELARPCQLTLPCAGAGDRAAQPLPLQLQLQIHASVGVAVYPADAREARSLMQLADAALYQAKAAGKGCARRHGDARRCPHA
jgi:GGDEF domain-containing protein